MRSRHLFDQHSVKVSTYLNRKILPYAPVIILKTPSYEKKRAGKLLMHKKNATFGKACNYYKPSLKL